MPTRFIPELLGRQICLASDLRTTAALMCRALLEESEAWFALLNLYNIAVRIPNVAARLAALVHWLCNKLGSSAPPEFVARLKALSRCRRKSATALQLLKFQAAVTASRHVLIAAARKVRCVEAEVRWRWTLKVLKTAA
jgi:hypothetical protein